MSESLRGVIEYLSALKEESDVSKKFKEKTDKVIQLLENNSTVAIEKALLELEELSSLEMSSYHRTQVWDVIGMLESINK